jgi:hypothetical protein
LIGSNLAGNLKTNFDNLQRIREHDLGCSSLKLLISKIHIELLIACISTSVTHTSSGTNLSRQRDLTTVVKYGKFVSDEVINLEKGQAHHDNQQGSQ